MLCCSNLYRFSASAFSTPRSCATPIKTPALEYWPEPEQNFLTIGSISLLLLLRELDIRSCKAGYVEYRIPQPQCQYHTNQQRQLTPQPSPTAKLKHSWKTDSIKLHLVLHRPRLPNKSKKISSIVSSDTKGDSTSRKFTGLRQLTTQLALSLG